jgi:glutamate racemase
MNPTRNPLVGVFDSGVGGLSVLKALHAQLPSHDLLYVADSAHAPYGERADDYISQRTHRIASHLLAEDAGLLVIACNTATAVASSSLRERWPRVPIVAVEPGVKPAVALTRNGHIGVMATPATLRSGKFKHLLDAHSAGIAVHLQPCPGLAGQIEQGIHDDPVLLNLIRQFTAPLKAAHVDTVVLGCTHYPFAHEQIQQAFGERVTLVDTAEAVARQAARLLNAATVTSPGPRRVRLQTTGHATRLAELAARWLPFACEVQHAPGL